LANDTIPPRRWSLRAHVEYDVPVTALVDTDTGQVESVVVWCEGIEQRDSEYSIVSADNEMPVGDPHRERAQEIVDSVVWPAWDLG
jgi:hypothetical protein